MSELKGQILGVILAIALFGIISVAMKGAFTSYSEKISTTVTETLGAGSGTNNPDKPE